MERLDSRVRIIWVVSVLFSAVIIGAISAGVLFFIGGLNMLILDSPLITGVSVFVIATLLGCVYTIFRYRSWRFAVREDTLYIERGVLVKVRTVAPYVRVQHVDARRGPLHRVLGLGSIVVYTAGSRGADVSIPGLDTERTAEVQETLRRLAIESEPDSRDSGDAV